jgi:hypothetical protein
MRTIIPKPEIFIEVWITNNKKFRARVTNGRYSIREITVGGKNWNEGVLGEYQSEILRRCSLILGVLQNELKTVIDHDNDWNVDEACA